ncbi:MAG TPA: AAA family ATPase [Pseudonocardiaceae bacterium]|jgi:type III restriction enzyme|nr:AAA family ATPase [Pseudonocardiaceae bacterium]
MSSENIDKGTHYHRCDFQVHTPRDAQWKGARSKSLEERKVYAAAFVAKCRGVGLHAVAITDHHDLIFAPLIRTAAAAEVGPDGKALPAQDRLVVFPGVELTLGVPCQALLILDADLPDDRLPLVIEALAAKQHDPDAHSLPNVTRLDHISSLRDLYTILDQRDWLRGRYIVLPNVTDNGHGTLMRSGMQSKYKEMPCVGGYLDGSVDAIGAGNARKFAGEDAAWGSKPLAIFQTSDSRNATLETLGARSTWVKWVAPTAEALRQACLGHQSRISQTQPQLPSVYISRLVVSNSKFLGPLDICFNPQYNALIGGRGTGKSTILDYLRWSLCDQAADASDDELANPSVRRRNLITATLASVGGQVEVYFTINQIPHVVRRHAVTNEILLKVGAEDFVKTREADVRALLPVHAYSQKQLSSVALRVDELSRFVTAPIKPKLDNIDQRIGESADRLRENYATLQRVRGLDINIARSVLAEQSLAEQAANLRSSLGGLSDDDRSILDSKPAADRIRDYVANWQRDLEHVAQSATAFMGEIDRAIRDLAVLEGGPASVSVLAGQLRSENERIVSELRAAVGNDIAAFTQARGAGSTQQLALDSVSRAIEAFDINYEEVKGRSSAHEVRLAELTEIEGRRKSSGELLQRQQRERRGLGDPQKTHISLRAHLVALHNERSKFLAAECEHLTKLSDGLLRATMNRGRGLQGIEAKFRSLIQGSGVRGARVDALFSQLQEESDPIGTWESVLEELEHLLLLGDESEHTSEMTPNLSRLGLPLADQKRVRGRITPDGWLDLALIPISDEPLFEYQTKEREFISFNSASAGQQATALLRILLAQMGMPLIVDQPEEDLDSQVIQDVVERIWRAKQGRQLIFASHNANLVVNGDAELVIACDYRKAGDQSGGRVKLEGAIDMPTVRDEITHVMEGGEKAFRLRKEKYGF